MEHLPSEPPSQLPSGLPADNVRRMELARLTGAVELWCLGAQRGQPDAVVQPVLLGYSRDPALWGVILGGALAHIEIGDGAYERVAEVARAAGADEQAAETHRVWLRSRPGL